MLQTKAAFKIKKNTHFVFSKNFSENRGFYNKMGRQAAGDNIIRRMRLFS